MMRFNKQVLIGLSLCVPLLGSVAWAENFRLDSVDFISSNGRTDIILHTGSILPVHKVLVSDNKLILDVDQVNADETVRTNFSGATNVSNVIFKPLGTGRIRLIVRGQNLGSPSIAFNSPVAHDVGHFMDRLPETTAAGLNEMQNAGMQTAALNTMDQGTETPAVDNQPLDISNGNSGENTPLISAPISDSDLKAPQNAPVLPISTANQEQPGNGGELLNRFFNLAAAGGLDNYLPYGLLGLLLLGAGLFVRHRLSHLDQEPSLEDLIDEQAQGKKISFREMADAYRHQNEVCQGAAPQKKIPGLGAQLMGKDAPVSRPEMQTARKPQGDRVIGLGALKGRSEPSGQSSRQAAYLESLMAAASTTPEPAAPIQAPLPAARQAVNQYQKAQQQKPAAAPKPKKNRALADQKMAEETRRIQAQQKQMQALMQETLAAKKAVAQQPIAPARNPAATNPRPLANPAAAGQQDLPGNPQVLDFLRNVAELMEKDGKPEIARNIQRNLETI